MINTKTAAGFRRFLNSTYANSLNEKRLHSAHQTDLKEAEPMNKTRNTKHKISANKLVMPIIFILAILHVVIILLIKNINQTSNMLATTQRNAGIYTQEATSILAGSSLLSETATSFILVPEMQDGSVNTNPLLAYANELSVDRRGDQVMARFKNYEVSDEIKSLLQEAADCANYMMEAQLHAFSLMNSVYPIPDEEPLNHIPLIELTEEELHMPDAAKEGLAKSLLLNGTYGEKKGLVSQYVNRAQGMIQGASAATTAALSQKIGKLRTSMWIVTASIIVILTITFFMLYKKILKPLGDFTNQITNDDFLDENEGFKEISVLATAYNDVLKRRNALDKILRSAAETDALTNLQNRYSFEQYILESEEKQTSVAVFLFDVNYLKQTNDTLGHLAGDHLICTAAECISECFGDKCYRFGGDEFAAIVEHCNPPSLQHMIRKFEAMEKERNISISYGYAYTKDLSSTSYKELLDTADRNMYTQKRETHKSRSDSENQK